MSRAKKEGKKRRNRKNLAKNIKRIQNNETVIKSFKEVEK